MASSENSDQLEKHTPTVNALEKHTEHSSRYHGHLAGNHNDVRKRDHDYLSQIRVIKTNDGKEIVSLRVPMTIKSQLGNPTALAIGAFATTLTTLSLSLMGWRGLSVTNVFIENYFFVAGIGMVISAQWELVLKNSYGYTVLSAFGFFYGGFGAILTPAFGVRAAYGDDLVSYNNALGYFVLSESIECCVRILLTSASVGSVESLLPNRKSYVKRSVYRHLFHCPAGLHARRSVLFCSRRWPCSRLGSFGKGWGRIRFPVRSAWILHSREFDVPRESELSLPDGRYQQILRKSTGS